MLLHVHVGVIILILLSMVSLVQTLLANAMKGIWLMAKIPSVNLTNNERGGPYIWPREKLD